MPSNVLVPETTLPTPGEQTKWPDTKNHWYTLSHKALNHLLAEQAVGFSNSRHVMPFSREIFRVSADLQEGDVFQRALIADTLLDFYERHHELKEVIDLEAGYLLGVRRKTGIGGWAYFPNLSELPPDADDLAQVMQVLIRAGWQGKAKPFIDEPLAVLLNEQTNADGWETWIIPAQNQNEEQQLQVVWVNKAWGTGSDIEVIANLIYALILFDKESYADAISRGLSFLLNSHQNSFYWKSTWYHGDYYGTYVSVRAICAANGPKDIVEGAITFLENSRCADGSWGIDEQGSSALQTALALLTLSIAKDYLAGRLDEEWLLPSLHYLQQTYTTSEGWPASPFIKMPLGRPYGFIHTILSYESASITNNYIAKACNYIYYHLLNNRLS